MRGTQICASHEYWNLLDAIGVDLSSETLPRRGGGSVLLIGVLVDRGRGTWDPLYVLYMPVHELFSTIPI